MFRVITPKTLFFPEIKEFVDQWWSWWEVVEVVGGIIIAITLRYQKAPAELTGPALAGGSGSEKLQS